MTSHHTPRRRTATAVLAAVGLVLAVCALVSQHGTKLAVAQQSEDANASDDANSNSGVDADALVSLLELVIDPDTGDAESAKKCLGVLAEKIQTRELTGEPLAALQPRLDKLLAPVLAGKADAPLYLDAALLASSWKNPAALAAVRKVVSSAEADETKRLAAIDAHRA